jgi:hypothetical protein
MLDRTWQLAFTSKFRADELIEHCVAVATVGGSSVIDPAAKGLTSVADRPGLEVGDPAELVLVEGDTVTAAVMDRPKPALPLRRALGGSDQNLPLAGRPLRVPHPAAGVRS